MTDFGTNICIMPYICKPNVAKTVLQIQKTGMHESRELLYIIVKKKIDEEFGVPFIEAFEDVFGEAYDKEQYIATGICCSLFLSSIIKGFPTEKLHTYVRCVRETYPFIVFNCNKYDELYNRMKGRTLSLMDKDFTFHGTETGKSDILEAFDFVTNG